MEHSCLNAYIRMCGIACTSADSAGNIFATGQSDKEKHRDNISGLHPFLVPFDTLARLESKLYERYIVDFAALDVHEQSGAEEEARNDRQSDVPWVRLLNDKFIGISQIPRNGVH